MTELLKPDICVIGAGSGGLSVAAAAAAFGVPVVLIEKGKMGGECLNTGCVPSKSLIAAGRRARVIAEACAFGVTAQAFCRLGAEVTVLEAAEPLSRDDPECRTIVLDQLAREGVSVRSGVAVARVEQAQSKLHVVLGGATGEERIAGSHLLIATGRR